jgi:hypothetical protein
MESNVLYAVASPGILRLWPWVNQVCFLPQRVSNGQNHFSQSRIRRLSQSLPRCPLRSLCSSLNAWGMCATFFFCFVHEILFLTPLPPCPLKPTCYPRGGLRHVGWSHDRQGRVALGTPRTTEQSDDRVEQPGCVGRSVGRAMDVARGRTKLCERMVQSRI